MVLSILQNHREIWIFPLIVIVMMMMMMMMMMMVMMMVMIHRWCNFLRSRQLSYIVLFSSISSRHFTSSLLRQEISKVSSHLSQKGYWTLIFFCLETCSRKSLSFLIPTPIIIVTDIESREPCKAFRSFHGLQTYNNVGNGTF